MGIVRTRFRRDVPLEDAKYDEVKLLTPNPRLISNKLLARDEFKLTKILNLLATAWMQVFLLLFALMAACPNRNSPLAGA